jgi:hypothetical protein
LYGTVRQSRPIYGAYVMSASTPGATKSLRRKR